MQARVPGGARRPVQPVPGDRQGTELGTGGFGDHDPAAGFKPLHEHVGGLRDVVGVYGGAVGVEGSLHVHQVLDGDRQSAEPPRMILLPPVLACREPLRVVARTVVAADRQGVDLAVDGLDPRCGRLDEIERRDLAALQLGDSLGGGQSDEIGFGHLDSASGTAFVASTMRNTGRGIQISRPRPRR